MPHRYWEPKPREDGFFVPGKRIVVFKCNVWRIIGGTGEVRGEAGMPNATFCKPIGEHIKNTLRGRKAWGLKHMLTGTWAELPAGQMELAASVAHGGAPAKRCRASAPGRAQPMADLGSAEQ